ncbi:MAG: RHS repeat-associated core domain-containing protein [Candidatus Woesearchaeota archaeon]
MKKLVITLVVTLIVLFLVSGCNLTGEAKAPFSSQGEEVTGDSEARAATPTDEHFILGADGTEAVFSEGELQYLHRDYLGSTRAVTGSSGELKESDTRLPYGGARGASGQRYTYTGKEAEGDLYYYGARYYDADSGRFTQKDPVIDGKNWYIYANNNPLKYIDPTGLNFEDSVTSDQLQGYFDEHYAGRGWEYDDWFDWMETWNGDFRMNNPFEGEQQFRFPSYVPEEDWQAEVRFQALYYGGSHYMNDQITDLYEHGWGVSIEEVEYYLRNLHVEQLERYIVYDILVGQGYPSRTREAIISEAQAEFPQFNEMDIDIALSAGINFDQIGQYYDSTTDATYYYNTKYESRLSDRSIYHIEGYGVLDRLVRVGQRINHHFGGRHVPPEPGR